MTIQDILRKSFQLLKSNFINKQDTEETIELDVYEGSTIDIDDTPTENSDNLVKSGGVHAALEDKVDKVEGKGLSTNDYDNTAKAKVDAIPPNPKYTDTVYDDTVIRAEVSANTSARHSHSNKSLLDTYTQTESNLSDAVSKKHSHNNKSYIDGLSDSYINSLIDTKLGVVENGNY